MSPDANILGENLSRLSLRQPALARQLAEQTPAPLIWTQSRDLAVTASISHNGRNMPLASKYAPLEEATRFAEQIEPATHAVIVCMGFGVGHHIAAAAQRLQPAQHLLLIYEPDPAIVRAALERVDHTAWLGHPHIVLIVGRPDQGQVLSAIDGFGSMMTQGMTLLHHPPSRQLHSQAFQQFGNVLTEVVSYFRTHVATSLVNASRTVRNLVANAGCYAAGATTDPLHRVAMGYPAVCVGAGPSLAKNADLLRDPNVRRNVIVISAQTTLKPLLDRGIRPDFVTALDYHEISRRFYEGLPRLDDPLDTPVTLVAEAKANPSILDSFPGPVRVTQNAFLDRLLGPLARPITPIPSGATVAHLSFYLAQHLGCDPIILIGQDLGFSDGLYYCPGTAIHDVWDTELNDFNTLEMMEWQRIVRHRGLLRKLIDVHGRPIHSDEQMLTYHKQFERDFAEAGQVVIDATEGGLPKAHTLQMTLAAALAEHAGRPVPPLPVPDVTHDPDRLAAALEQVQRRLDEIQEIRRLSHATIPLVEQMIVHQREFDRATALFDRIEKNRRRVETLNEAFSLVLELNTLGTFRRLRADRAIQGAGTDPYEVQRRQMERDLDNLRMLVQACDETTAIFADGVTRLKTLTKADVVCEQAA